YLRSQTSDKSSGRGLDRRLFVAAMLPRRQGAVAQAAWGSDRNSTRLSRNSNKAVDVETLSAPAPEGFADRERLLAPVFSSRRPSSQTHSFIDNPGNKGPRRLD